MSQYINTPQPSPGVPTPGPAERGTQRAGGALASLILGILSILLFCIGLVFGIPALIVGLVSLKKISGSGGQLTGKGLAITGACLGGLGSIACVVWGIFFIGAMREADTSDVQQSRLEIAETNIRTKSGDKVGHGNSLQAEEMAERFAARMKLMRESFFTGESEGVLSGGEFLTHCELSEGRCAFIVHVPELRKFEDDAKESLCDIAWTIAEGTLAESGIADGTELAVGVKGFLLYEDIMLGTFKKDEEESEKRSVGSNTERLAPFFPEPADESGETSGEATAPGTAAGETLEVEETPPSPTEDP